MNVLTLLDTFPVSGPAKGLLQLVAAADELGVHYTVCNFEYPGRPSAFNELAARRIERFATLRWRAVWDWRFLADLRALALRDNIDIVQSHSLKPHLAACWLSRRLGLPWLAFAHGWTQEDRKVRLYNALEQRLLRRADHVVAVTGRIRDILVRQGRTGPISVVPNAVDPRVPARDPDRRAQARLRFGLGEADLLLAVIGRLSYEKGQDILLDALARLDSGCSWHVVFAGDGPERAALTSRAGSLGLSDRVSFLGHVADPAWIYEAADALVIPSRSEGVPNVALEALAHGLPVLATDVGNLHEMIMPGETGWLVPDIHPDALARALRELVAARDRLTEMGREGNRRILPGFTVERRIATMRSLYRELQTDQARPIRVGG